MRMLHTSLCCDALSSEKTQLENEIKQQCPANHNEYLTDLYSGTSWYFEVSVMSGNIFQTYLLLIEIVRESFNKFSNETH